MQQPLLSILVKNNMKNVPTGRCILHLYTILEWCVVEMKGLQMWRFSHRICCKSFDSCQPSVYISRLNQDMKPYLVWLLCPVLLVWWVRCIQFSYQTLEYEVKEHHQIRLHTCYFFQISNPLYEVYLQFIKDKINNTVDFFREC